jgi:hypothetical protein
VRIRSLPGAWLIAMLALGATASGAPAKKRLVLKEEGVPVGVGGELGVELNLGRCLLGERAHLSRNDAPKDKLTLRETVATHCDTGTGFSDVSVSGVQAIAMTDAGGATFNASLRLAESEPGLTCVYEFRKLSGTFRLPGPAVTEGSAVGTLNQRESSKLGCDQSPHFRVAIYGHNGNLLEAELLG